VVIEMNNHTMTREAFRDKAQAFLVHISDEDVQTCWQLLMNNPEEMAELDDWIHYLETATGCCGYDTLQMDILLVGSPDKVNVTFLREEHTCSRYGLLDALKQFRESIA